MSILNLVYKSYKLKTTGEILVISYEDGFESSRTWDNLGVIDLDCGRYITRNEGKGIYFDEVVAAYKINASVYNSSQANFTLGDKITTAKEFENTEDKIFITKKTLEMCGTPPEYFEHALAGELELITKEYVGEVYEFTLYSPDLENVDSCCGFYSVEYILEHLSLKAEDLEEVELMEQTKLVFKK